MTLRVLGRLSMASWTLEHTLVSKLSRVGRANTETATPFRMSHGWKLAKVEL